MNQIECPHCSHRMKYGDNVAGKKVKCQKCGHGFRLPALSLSPENVPSEPSLTAVPDAMRGGPSRRRYWLVAGVFLALVGCGAAWYFLSGKTISPVNSANAKKIMHGVFSNKGMTIKEAEEILGPGEELGPDSEFLTGDEKRQRGQSFMVWEKRRRAGKNGEHIRVAYLQATGKIVSVSPNVKGWDEGATAP